jgi:hypothetical protein
MNTLFVSEKRDTARGLHFLNYQTTLAKHQWRHPPSAESRVNGQKLLAVNQTRQAPIALRSDRCRDYQLPG